MNNLSAYNLDDTYDAVLVKSVQLNGSPNSEIKELTLEIDAPEFECSINQSIGVLLQIKGEFGKHQHFRLYSLADLPRKVAGKTQLNILVKRCSYVDEFSGETQKGISSHFLCDLKEGDPLTITGPHGMAFEIPKDPATNLILVSMGTGIAPFRAFIKQLYAQEKQWKGKIRLFYGAKSGTELVYRNERNNDLSQYYDEGTFEAFEALSARPHWNDHIPLDDVISKQKDELLELLAQNNTRIYLAGYENVKEQMNRAFEEILGSEERWATRKAELRAGKKWAEVVY